MNYEMRVKEKEANNLAVFMEQMIPHHWNAILMSRIALKHALIKGMLVKGDKGQDMAMYTGSTTGTSRDNMVCSRYTPITWQVDRKCHMVSASSFDKMCADMKAKKADMSSDLHPHGARALVSSQFVANNQQSRK